MGTMNAPKVELLPHTRAALIVGWTAVAAHAIAFAGIITLIITR